MQPAPILEARCRRKLGRGWILHAPTLEWQQCIDAPCVWEDAGLPRAFEGPVDYRLEFSVQPRATRRYWLHFGGVSYAVQGWLNETPIGYHRGIWDAFCWELTPALQAGLNQLRLQVIKNGGTQFPVPQVLSGFLPYVSSTFGGIWQPVYLFHTGEAWLSDLYVHGEADGTLHMEGFVAGEGTPDICLTLFNQHQLLYETRWQGVGRFEHQVRLSRVLPWSPDDPVLYRCRVEVWLDGALSHTVEQLVGFRTLQVDGTRILLNGQPFYPRGLLSWGWYLYTHAPAPPQKIAQRELRHLRELGFNMLKACLWVPPRHYLALCDQMGIALWLELPLWLPQMDAAQIEQVKCEYEAIVRQVRSHPSILIWTLGCELSQRFPQHTLGELYGLVKQLTGSPLVRDNSGGGECYGGALKEYADFADYHLYTDLPFVRTTFRAFLERIRPAAPWLQGEFCDHDTLRDFKSLRQQVKPRYLWWLESDPEVNPQGVRWFYETPFVEERLQQQGLDRYQARLVQGSRQELLVHHKFTLEQMRSLPGTSGYVVTGLKDTPIATAGLLDERSMPKVPSRAYKVFNSDTVLLLDWHRRRVWLAGGDRPANPDPFNHFGGQTLYPTLAVSHFGAPIQQAELRWRLRNRETLDAGEVQPVQLGGGQVEAIAMLELPAPAVRRPREHALEAELWADGRRIADNRWRLWLYPRPHWQEGLSKCALYDPDGSLIGLPALGEVFLPLARGQTPDLPLLLATRWADWMRDYLRHGGHILLILTDGASLVQEPLPFWREATHLLVSHPLFRQLGLRGYADERLFAFSTDRALHTEPSRLAIDPAAEWQSLWRRVDTRTGWATDYLAEVRLGNGRMLLTTLHFAGPLGDLPLSMQYHPAGQYWLYQMLRYLRPSR
ncbi:Beta-galactosidase [bacterium HR15]|nr:Beta-galactosidase [bacterium HR15]